jgi:GNAT superfamily N-acetyltransferase
MQITIVPFDRKYDRSRFDCGNADLNGWLQRYAGQSEDRDSVRTSLAVDGRGDIVGYYSLVASEVDPGQAAATLGIGKRRYSVPAMLIARLAVDRSRQGQGLGRSLLVDALQKLAQVGGSVGFEVVVVDAIDDGAASFYRRHGFVAFGEDRHRLSLTTKSLRLTFGAG